MFRSRFPNDLDALRRKLWLNRLRGGTAAVIVGASGPESGTGRSSGISTRELRELCDEFNALLVFDEVVTDFGCMGGAQGYFQVRPGYHSLGQVSHRRLSDGRRGLAAGAM